VGPSGSGKTTLLGLIAGTLSPVSGLVEINETNIIGLGDRDMGRFRIKNIGQVFQSFELLDYLTILENVMLPWFIAGKDNRPEVHKRATKLLRDVGLASRTASRPGDLSQGEQQRVAVCRAMLNNPALLLADEPTGNLDRENKLKVVDILLQQARQNDSTLLMVTHDESLLDRFDTVQDIRMLARPGGTGTAV
jgi:putative ABC transport system ATP-binding protein